MILFNTSFHLNPPIKEAFLSVLRKEFIPKVLQSNLLTTPQLTQVVIEEQEQEYITFALQFHCKDRDTLHQWQAQEGIQLFANLQKHFGEQMLCFNSLLIPTAHE